jgi:dTDP-4-amino-4,6-dideoxygalactose transaminase
MRRFFHAMISCANPLAQYLSLRGEIDEAVLRVLRSGSYILGAEVSAFEEEFAAWLGAPHGVGVASGTDALHIALRALGVGPGDEVITTAFTAVGTVAAIELAGATPVFADIDPASCTLDPAAAEAAVTPRTRAIVPVHLYGAPADLDPLLALADRRGLRVVEDCAQAHGARYKGRRVGTFGDFGCFSCYPTKNLGALGDAGILVARDAALASRACRLRQYGWDAARLSGLAGLNSRLDAVQAAVLRVKLPRLDADNAARIRLAGLYGEGLAGAGVEPPRPRPGDAPVFHLYTVRSPRRDALRAFLAARGIESRVHYDAPVHRQPAYAGRIAGDGALPETERAAREVLSLPMYPELRDDEARAVIDAVRAFAAGA